METLTRRHRCCQEKHSLETLVFSSSPHTISFIGFKNSNEKGRFKGEGVDQSGGVLFSFRFRRTVKRRQGHFHCNQTETQSAGAILAFCPRCRRSPAAQKQHPRHGSDQRLCPTSSTGGSNKAKSTPPPPPPTPTTPFSKQTASVSRSRLVKSLTRRSQCLLSPLY